MLLKSLIIALKDTLITRFTELTSVGVSIIKGANKLEVVGRLRGFSRGAIT